MRRVVGRGVRQECATPRFKLDSENVLIPGGKRFRVVTLYEDNAKAGDLTSLRTHQCAEHNSALATRVRPLMLSIPLCCKQCPRRVLWTLVAPYMIAPSFLSQSRDTAPPIVTFPHSEIVTS